MERTGGGGARRLRGAQRKPKVEPALQFDALKACVDANVDAIEVPEKPEGG